MAAPAADYKYSLKNWGKPLFALGTRIEKKEYKDLYDAWQKVVRAAKGKICAGLYVDVDFDTSLLVDFPDQIETAVIKEARIHRKLPKKRGAFRAANGIEIISRLFAIYTSSPRLWETRDCYIEMKGDPLIIRAVPLY
jgi:hypothetical protein